MHSRDSFVRLIICYFICLCLAVYSFCNRLSPTGFALSDTAFFESETHFTSSQEEIPPETENEPQQEKETSQPVSSQETVSASAQAVKGKVVTRYISPYTAPISYNKAYMKNSSGLSVSVKDLLNSNIKFKISENSSPQVLIMHTHTTETFMEKSADFYTDEYKARTTDNNKNMVKIGDIVAEKLNASGIKTLHDKTKHDYPEYTGSYGRSAKTVTEYLKKYPSIKVVLDLHRDSVSMGGNDKAKLVTEINGKKAAQVMLVMGSQSGSVKNHPNWKENLKLALKLQQTMETKYPTLARPLLLMPKNYNQKLTIGSMLIEFGTDVNTLQEACYSAELVGESLVSMLKTLK